MGQIGAWMEKNTSAGNQANNIGAPNNTPPIQSVPSSPSEPNNTLTGKVAKDGVTGGHVTGIVGDASK